jgi:hypothetical protein
MHDSLNALKIKVTLKIHQILIKNVLKIIKIRMELTDLIE